MDSKPYRFERMTGAEFSAALNRLGLSVGEFRRLTGASAKKAQEWLAGSEDIPPWVPVFLAAGAIPEALQAAKDEAAKRALP
jgi:hypothetical protein